MRRHKITDQVPAIVKFSWLNLAFTAGVINTGGFLACRRFVSHVTGFVTLSGVELTRQSWSEALGAVSIPLFFITGAMTSAWFTEPRPGDPQPRSLTPALTLVAAIMGATIVLGHQGFFGPFGITEDIMQDYYMLALLSSACGIQNATATSASASSIRPTHLTGTATDLGIGIVRATVSPRGSEDRRNETTVTLRRLALMGAFITGAIVGSWVFVRFEYTGFLLPMATSVLAVIFSLRGRAGTGARPA